MLDIDVSLHGAGRIRQCFPLSGLVAAIPRVIGHARRQGKNRATAPRSAPAPRIPLRKRRAAARCVSGLNRLEVVRGIRATTDGGDSDRFCNARKHFFYRNDRLEQKTTARRKDRQLRPITDRYCRILV
ncbi:hypothetical protein [Burkholderia sp. BCC1977]|uniref:hypothetical protein n=1 Tax=Burkholderia sp. BCC1977 TaxID=2817440 RepID=UPI002ABD6D2F|nr:hypothetical protein [Burkholderia sp. BCC1977]